MSMQVPKAVRRYLHGCRAMGDGGRFGARIMTSFSKRRTRNDPFPMALNRLAETLFARHGSAKHRYLCALIDCDRATPSRHSPLIGEAQRINSAAAIPHAQMNEFSRSALHEGLGRATHEGPLGQGGTFLQLD